jgi:uncharacterized MnhB-related membrane protein
MYQIKKPVKFINIVTHLMTLSAFQALVAFSLLSAIIYFSKERFVPASALTGLRYSSASHPNEA